MEAFSTVCTGSLETVLHENSPTRGLLTSKQLSKDSCNTISIEKSTGNAPNSINNAQYILTDEVYTNLEKSNAKKAIGIKNNANAQKHLTPVTIMVVDTISSIKSRILLKVLLDSGSTTTMINRKCLPRHCQPCKISNSRKISTLAGSYISSEMVVLRNLRLPELDKNRNIDQQKALIFDAESCKYDVILGADFLSKTGIDVKYSTGTIEWFDNELPLRDTRTLQSKDFLAMADIIEMQEEHEFFGMDWYDPHCHATEILDAKYEKVLVDDVIDQLTHLNAQQKSDIRQVLNEHTKLFDGTLGVYPHRTFHIDLVPGAVPKHSRPYPIPVIHLQAFKKELLHLVEIGVLSPQGASEWASPTFITPKKDGRVRWVSDLRELNKVVRRKQYPLPIIGDILRRREGYKFFTKLDISMQYYTFELDDESKDLCTIATPFGKFKYNRLPMGLKCSPDYAQEVMENIFRDVTDAEVYIDDIGAFSNSWEEHMTLLSRILTLLQDNGFTVNPLKCEWAVKETDWLGYWLTPTGLKPWKKKIEAILRMQPPSNLKQLRGFIGMVNYYRDMWPHRSHILAPITAKTGTPKKGVKAPPFEWTPEMQKAFDQMKALMAAEVLCAYPNHNKPFKIYTDASNYQLGACLMQDDRPVAYFSRKLNSAQCNYATIDKELLCVVATLKEFRSMLLGAELHIYTDHKNILNVGDSSERRLRWISYVDEYGPTLHYIEGPRNVIADTFSRLSRKDVPSALVGKKVTNIVSNSESNNEIESLGSSLTDDTEILECLLNLPCISSNKKQRHAKRRKIDNKKSLPEKKAKTLVTTYSQDHCHTCKPLTKRKVETLVTEYNHCHNCDFNKEHCYLNLPEDMVEDNPLDLENIKEKQDEDNDLSQSQLRHPTWYSRKNINDVHDILCYTKPGDNAANWKIALPKDLIRPTIMWYHQVTGHPGSKRLYQHLHQRYYHRDLRRLVDNFNCDYCQRNKLDGRGYGFLPEREVRSIPFEECAVDLIGPWTVQVRGRPYEFLALTAIDTVTNLVELIRIDNKESNTVARKFAQCWLTRYPWPQRCIHDPGTEFTGPEFQTLLQNCHIRDVCTTAKNPQSNAVCERMHQTVGNVLRTLLHGNPPQNIASAEQYVDEALSIAMHAMRAGIHTTLGSSPGNLVFNRDMFLNIPLIADWHAITQRREHLIHENLMRENQKRRGFDYAPQQRVLKKKWKPRKLDERTSGPYEIVQTHVNGTLTIQLRPGLTERINIRRVIPYRQ